MTNITLATGRTYEVSIAGLEQAMEDFGPVPTPKKIVRDARVATSDLGEGVAAVVKADGTVIVKLEGRGYATYEYGIGVRAL